MAKSVYLVFGLLLVGFRQIYAIDPGSEDAMALLKVLRDTCTKETGVDVKLVINANYGELADDPTLKCYMRCILMTIQVMDEDGNMDLDVLIEIIPDQYKSLAAPIVRKCGVIKGTDDCDTAYRTNVCWQKNGPFYYLLP